MNAFLEAGIIKHVTYKDTEVYHQNQINPDKDSFESNDVNENKINEMNDVKKKNPFFCCVIL